MTWVQLSLKQWRHRPLRTGVSAAGVAIAVASFFSLISFEKGYREGVRLELERLGAHILLVPKGCPYDAASMALHGANWPCYLKQSFLEEVRSVPGIAAAAPVFMAAVYEHGSKLSVYAGVDTNILALKRAWKLEGAFPSENGAVLLGAEVGRRHQCKPGAELRLPGLTGEVAKVSGIIAPTHAAEDSFIYLRLADAQRLFQHTNQLTHVLIRLKEPNQLDQVVTQLRGCDAGLSMNVIPLAHVFHTIQSVVNSTRLLLACVAVVALLVAGTGVSNTILMSVAERWREIGVMRALGATRIRVFHLVWLESIQVCFTGAVVGVLLAFPASGMVESWARSKLPFAPVGSLVSWDWVLALACLAMACGLGSLAGFLPAWRAAAMPPALSFRTGEGSL